MQTVIHPIRTGSVRIKTAQRERHGGLVGTLLDSEWTEWLPIYAWVIDHPEGAIVVDTGETARSSEPGYFPPWHPYYRFAVRMDVECEQEIGPQLAALGIRPETVPTVIMTHLHTDHAGGLHHFPASEIWVAQGEHRAAQGLGGRIQGYLPHRWPAWFAPKPIPFQAQAIGPFQQHYAVTKAGDVVVVPTPGHTPHHISVIVRGDDVDYLLAGDTSYTEELLLARTPDGVSPKPAVTLATMSAILDYAKTRSLVYLPSHDPQSAARLEKRQVLPLSQGD